MSIRYCSYEDVQIAIKNSEKYLLVNTLSENQQSCLIYKTLTVDKEREIFSSLLGKSKLLSLFSSNNLSVFIVLYGKNNNDITVFKKYEQLKRLGFINVFIYLGGLFEWLLMQDIYGNELFPTTSTELDIFKFQQKSSFKQNLLIQN